MNSKSIVESIFEAAAAARLAAAELGKVAAAEAGKHAVDRVADKVLGEEEDPAVASGDAPVANQGGAQAVPDTQTQNPAGTEQGAPVEPQAVQVVPTDDAVDPAMPPMDMPAEAPSDVSLDMNPLDADAVNLASEDPQVEDPRSVLVNSLAGVNEVRYMSGLRKRIFRRG